MSVEHQWASGQQTVLEVTLQTPADATDTGVWGAWDTCKLGYYAAVSAVEHQWESGQQMVLVVTLQTPADDTDIGVWGAWAVSAVEHQWASGQ